MKEAEKMITEKQIQSIVEMAIKVMSGEISENSASQILHDKNKINKSSASMYMRAFIAMSRGENFGRTVRVGALKYYLEVLDQSGNLKNAIISLEKHLAFFEDVAKSKPVGKLELFQEYKEKINSNNTAEDFSWLIDNAKMEHRVNLEMDRSLEDLELELASRAKIKPKLFTVTTQVYARDPVVVAWALKKAKGKCGSCKKSAPFKKSSNNEPYLEVHHSKPLSEGGFDDMKNVIALCPNCHREMHHG
jgi:5-methylcytosine-specific restriction protein A